MKRRTALVRTTRIPPRNAERLARRQAEGEVYGPYHRWISEQSCMLATHPDHRCRGEVTGHHLKTVGAGGTDYANEIPLCQTGHTGLGGIHGLGSDTFNLAWEVDVRAEAKRYAAMWDARGQDEGF